MSSAGSDKNPAAMIVKVVEERISRKIQEEICLLSSRSY
jgi:hypothetical protein